MQRRLLLAEPMPRMLPAIVYVEHTHNISIPWHGNYKLPTIDKSIKGAHFFFLILLYPINKSFPLLKYQNALDVYSVICIMYIFFF